MLTTERTLALVLLTASVTSGGARAEPAVLVVQELSHVSGQASAWTHESTDEGVVEHCVFDDAWSTSDLPVGSWLDWSATCDDALARISIYSGDLDGLYQIDVAVRGARTPPVTQGAEIDVSFRSAFRVLGAEAFTPQFRVRTWGSHGGTHVVAMLSNDADVLDTFDHTSLAGETFVELVTLSGAVTADEILYLDLEIASESPDGTNFVDVGTFTYGAPVVVDVPAGAGQTPGPPALHLWPNPMRSRASGFIDVAAGGPALVFVSDVAGRRVSTLLASNLAPGRHRLSWNGTDHDGVPVAPGVYFVSVSLGSAVPGSQRIVVAP